ncbi:phosphoribosylanthranilate isomerase [Roseivirga sp. E12]|uniref:phosphoribosylanthranilate isomerase n=1 Tax=Roseivirga sp. E12 TaxID=2819237 RepID=UPI001ABC3B40|nr:phosphoribosylanthranilate isomerase [Roseivirga sp. E12]MBO3697316.1 phosphoribosylanthranilate isomerase [Roseivirga sp. E12]
MALRTFVRVNGINNLSDARYCAGMEVNELGFNIEADHSNYTDAEKFKEMSDWLSGVEFVGEITNESTDIKQAIEGYALDALQIENLSQIESALSTGLKVSFVAKSLDEAIEAWTLSNESLSHILLSTDQTSDYQFPVLLTEGFDINNLDSILKSSTAKGIVLEGGSEIRPGYKDFDELADILELLEIDDMA